MCTSLIDGINKSELSLCTCSNRLKVIIPTWFVVGIWLSCVISGSRREVGESCALPRYYAASSGNFLPTFRDNLSAPPSNVKNAKSCLDYWPFKMGSTGSPETSVNYHYSLRNNVAEGSFHLALLSEVYESLYPSRRCCSILNRVTNRFLPDPYQLMWPLVTWNHYKLRSIRMLHQIPETNIAKIRLSAFK